MSFLNHLSKHTGWTSVCVRFDSDNWLVMDSVLLVSRPPLKSAPNKFMEKFHNEYPNLQGFWVSCNWYDYDIHFIPIDYFIPSLTNWDIHGIALVEAYDEMRIISSLGVGTYFQAFSDFYKIAMSRLYESVCPNFQMKSKPVEMVGDIEISYGFDYWGISAVTTDNILITQPWFYNKMLDVNVLSDGTITLFKKPKHDFDNMIMDSIFNEWSITGLKSILILSDNSSDNLVYKTGMVNSKNDLVEFFRKHYHLA